MSGRPQHFAKIVVGILLLAVALRVAYVLESRHDVTERFPTPELDGPLHLRAADELGLGPEAGPRFALMTESTPVYPAVLRAASAVVGEGQTGLRILQGLLGGLTVLCLVAAARRLAGDGPALATGLLAAVYPPLIHFDTHFEKAAPELLALSLAVLLVLRRPATRRGLLLQGLGLGLALAYLVGSQLGSLPIALVVIVYLARFAAGGWRQRLLPAGLAAGMVVLALVGLRVFHDRTPPLCRAQSGIHVRIGWNEHATGAYFGLPDIKGLPTGHVFLGHAEAELAAGRLLDDRESDSWQLHRATAWVSDEPGAAVGLFLRKLRLALASFEAKGNDFFPDLAARYRVMSLPLPFGLLLVLAALGLTLPLAAPRGRLFLIGLAGAALVPVLVTFVTWRYRLPVIVPLLLAAGVGLHALARGAVAWVKSGQQPEARRFLPRAGLALAMGLLTFWPVPASISGPQSGSQAANRSVSQAAEAAARDLAAIEAAPSPTPAQQATRVKALYFLARHREAYLAAHQLMASGVLDAEVAAIAARYAQWLDDPAAARAVIAQVPAAQQGALRDNLLPLERRWLERFAQLRTTL